LVSFSQVLTQDGGHAQAWLEQGYLQLKAGQADAALDSYNRYLALRPDDAVALYNRGMAQHATERFAEAADSYCQAISADPSFAAAHNNLATTLSKLGQQEASLAAHRRSIELAPFEAHFPYNMGLVLHAL
jgi:tetratricopeptide (TPR) repeat protein